MWILTIIAFAHPCSMMNGDTTWSSTCPDVSSALEFMTESTCVNALKGVTLDGEDIFTEHALRLTHRQIAFCTPQKK
jgi:hypothetical protein